MVKVEIDETIELPVVAYEGITLEVESFSIVDAEDVNYLSIELELKAGESIEVVTLFTVAEEETYESNEIMLQIIGHESEKELEIEYKG